MEQQSEAAGRPAPAKVYPAVPDAAAWVVEAPASAPAPEGRLRTFTGATGLAQALEYAHRTYGSASYFSR